MNSESDLNYFWNLPDLALLEILKHLRNSFLDVKNLSCTCKSMNIYINDSFPGLYSKHVKIDSGDLRMDFSKPVLSLEVICKGGEQETDILLKTIRRLNLQQIRKLDLKCENKQSIEYYLKVREMMLKSISKTYLEDFAMDFSFLKTGHKTDHILEMFTTNWLFPNINVLTLRFFENVRQDWCDHNSNTLKLHLTGILHTNNIKTVKLVNLDNDSFYSISVFLDNIGGSDSDRVGNCKYRQITFDYKQGDLTTDFVIFID